MTISETITKLPTLEEVRKRAALFAKADAALYPQWKKEEELFHEEEDEKGKYAIHRWDDGGGQTRTIFFTDNHAVLLAFDHEDDFNFYAGEETDALNQVSFYEGLPSDLDRFVFNVPEDNFTLTIELPDGETVVAASAVVWWNGSSWEYSPAFDLLVEEVKPIFSEDGGLSYCFKPFFIEELTEESFLAYYAKAGYTSEDEIATLKTAWVEADYR